MTTNEQAEALARECAKSFYCYGDRLPLSDHIVISLPLAELIAVAEAAERIEQDAKFTLLEMGDNGKEMLMSLHKSLAALRAKLPKEDKP